MNYTNEEIAQILKENPDLNVELPRKAGKPVESHPSAKRHKYNAVRTVYNNIAYASKKEANYAQELDLRKKAGEIDFWLMQVPFSLPGNTVYRLDFVTFKLAARPPEIPDDVKRFVDCSWLYNIEFIEVKGFRTGLGELKRKQVEEIYKIKVNLI